MQRTLEEIDNANTLIAESEANKISSQNKLVLKKTGVEKLKAELKEFESLDEIENKIRDILVKLPWCEVAVQEGKLVELQNDFVKQQSSLQKLTDKHDKLRHTMDQLGDIDAFEAELKAVQDEQEEIEKIRKTLHIDFLSKKDMYEKHLSDMRALKASHAENSQRLHDVRVQVLMDTSVFLLYVLLLPIIYMNRS